MLRATFLAPFPLKNQGSKCTSIYMISTSCTKSKMKILILWVGFWTLYCTISYVKDDIKIYLHVTLVIRIPSMYLHPRAPTSCALIQIFNEIIVFDWFGKCTNLLLGGSLYYDKVAKSSVNLMEEWLSWPAPM